MKNSLLLLMLLATPFSLATFDVQEQVTIVVENIQTGEYFLQTTPAEYCVGIDSLTLASAITQPVTIKSNYGCGGPTVNRQINAATCALITADEVNNSDGSYNAQNVSITMNLSKCGKKAKNINFAKTLNKAISNSYTSKGYNIIKLNRL